MSEPAAQNGAAQRARTRIKKPPTDAQLKKLQARTRKSQARFLKAFAVTGNILGSAKAAKVGRRTVYDWLKSADFKELYDAAAEDASDVLEKEARRRAVDGVREPMVSAGSLVCHVRKYSDTLLIFLLKGRRPDVYRERHELTGKNGTPLKLTDVGTLTDTELETELLALAEKIKARKA